jgi:thioesterase domain-containing protein
MARLLPRLAGWPWRPRPAPSAPPASESRVPAPSRAAQQATVERLAPGPRGPEDRGDHSPVVTIQSQGRDRPLFMVHPIGGYVLCYSQLARHLGPNRPFYGLAAPGLVEEPDHCDPVEELASRYVAAVQRIQADGPYLLGGYSFGCVVAFEMAQQLSQQGQTTALLVLIDAPAPRREGSGRWLPDVRDTVLAARLLKQYAHACGQDFSGSDHALTQTLTEEEALLHLVDRAKQAALVPADTDLQWVRRFLRGFRTRVAVAARYVPRVYSGPIAFFRSVEDDEGIVGHPVTEPSDRSDPAKGWSRLARAPVEVHTVPGHHETLLVEPHVRVLAKRLGESLSRAEARLQVCPRPGAQGSAPH